MADIIQTDGDIPVYIVTHVDREAALLEETIASKRKSAYASRSKAGRRPRYIDLGLTIDEQDEDEQISEDDEDTNELLIHHAVPLLDASGAADEDEHDKENKDHSGRKMFSLTPTRGKSLGRMMKMAMTHVNQDEPQRLGKRQGKRKARASPDLEQAKRRRLQRQVELLKDVQSDEESAPEDHAREESASSDEEPSEPIDATPQGYERYFQDLHGSTKTSNNTLSKLAVLDPQEFHDILSSTPKKHASHVTTLFDMHKRYFPQWYFELQSGFNLVFYGYGSKRRLLNMFAQSALTDGLVVVINGFFPSITIKDILLKISYGLQQPPMPNAALEHASAVCSYFKSNKRLYDRLYLVVHDIDGSNLRNERCQSVLSMLASAPNIHLVASVDHINAGFLWDNIKTRLFNWIWHDATTYDDYLTETSFEHSLLMRNSEMGGARGVQYVLRSLTSNGRGVFRVLADQQLIEMEMAGHDGRGTEQVGLAYHKYYSLCREGFFVSTDLALRSQLTEFRDHKLIASKRLPDGSEVFYIPLDKSTLMGIVENMDEQG